MSNGNIPVRIRNAAIPKTLEGSPFIRGYEPEAEDIDFQSAINTKLDEILGNIPATAEAADIPAEAYPQPATSLGPRRTRGTPFREATRDFRGIPSYEEFAEDFVPARTDGAIPVIEGEAGAERYLADLESKGRLTQTDEARRNASIMEIAADRGVTFQEAADAYDEAYFELSGQRPAGAPETADPNTYAGRLAQYKEDAADRDQIISNMRRLARQAASIEERQAILAEGAQILRAEGLDKLKAPEQTIATTIEGQRVAIPVSQWKSEYGTKAKGKDTANIREATWLINKGIANNEREAYAMVKKAMAKDTTEKEWALGVRKRLNKKVDEGFLEPEKYQESYNAEMGFFRSLQGEQRPDASRTTLTPAIRNAIVQRIEQVREQGGDLQAAATELERRGLDPKTFGL